MRKKTVVICAAAVLAVVALVAFWVFLRPMTGEDAEGDGNEAWKLETVYGNWASEDGMYVLDVDGCDFTLKIDGVYRLIASFSFDSSGRAEDHGARFDLVLAPGAGACFNNDGTVLCEVGELWHEDDWIYISFAPGAPGEDSETVRLIRSQASEQNGYIYQISLK